jgi:hypothetical protein
MKEMSGFELAYGPNAFKAPQRKYFSRRALRDELHVFCSEILPKINDKAAIAILHNEGRDGITFLVLIPSHPLGYGKYAEAHEIASALERFICRRMQVEVDRSDCLFNGRTFEEIEATEFNGDEREDAFA